MTSDITFIVDAETLEETSKLARYAANASRFLKVLAIVGIFVDAFILAFDVSVPYLIWNIICSSSNHTTLTDGAYCASLVLRTEGTERTAGQSNHRVIYGTHYCEVLFENVRRHQDSGWSLRRSFTVSFLSGYRRR